MILAFAALAMPSMAAPSMAFPRADGLMGSKELADRLKSLERSHPDVVHVAALARSASDRDAWHVELGIGTPAERATRPAMLVVAGLAGEDFAGTAACLAWIEQLAADEAHAAKPDGLLRRTTIHVLPRVDPDAAEAWLSKPRGGTRLSGAPVDDDHDGLVDEDPPEDLDGDGLITWMRVEDPEGRFVPDPKEPRLLIEADRAKGEIPSWRLLTEGMDGDHDESWNEDGVGGTLLSRNFPFGYEWFEPASGPHPVSEPLSRALADFVVQHPAIAVAVVYGDADNLLGEAKGGRGDGKEGSAGGGRSGAGSPTAGSGTGASAAGGRGGRGGGGRRGDGPAKPPTTVTAEDAPYIAQMGKLYREALGLDEPLESVSKPGALADWLYFHRGVMALAARPFSPALQVAIAGAPKSEAPKGGAPKGGAPKGEAPKGEALVEAKPKEAKPKEAKPKEGDAAMDGDAANPPRAGAGADGQATEEPAAPAVEGEAAAERPDDDDRQDRPAKGRRGGKGGKGDDDDRGKEEREFLKWIDEHDPGRFVPWKAFAHPDFPGRRVEIGGFAPLARDLPPPAGLAEACRAQAGFLTRLAGKLPRVGLRRSSVRSLGKSVFEVTIEIENTGYLPTLLGHGVVTGAIPPTRIMVDLPDAAFLAGTRRTTLDPIPGGGGMAEARYVIHAPGTSGIDVEIVSALGGTLSARIDLPETRP